MLNLLLSNLLHVLYNKYFVKDCTFSLKQVQPISYTCKLCHTLNECDIFYLSKDTRVVDQYGCCTHHEASLDTSSKSDHGVSALLILSLSLALSLSLSLSRSLSLSLSRSLSRALSLSLSLSLACSHSLALSRCLSLSLSLSLISL